MQLTANRSSTYAFSSTALYWEWQRLGDQTGLSLVNRTLNSTPSIQELLWS